MRTVTLEQRVSGDLGWDLFQAVVLFETEGILYSCRDGVSMVRFTRVVGGYVFRTV